MGGKFIGKLERRLEIYGMTHLKDRIITSKTTGRPDIAAILRILYVEQNMSITSLARTFGVTLSAVYQMLGRCGLKPKLSNRTKFEASLEEHGYTSAKQFFAANMMKDFREMAKILEVTPETIARHYKRVILQSAGALVEGKRGK